MPRPSLFFILESMRTTLQELAATSFRADRFNQMLRWLAMIEKRLKTLETENQMLRAERRQNAAERGPIPPPPVDSSSKEFLSLEGVLWRRRPNGFESLPYCPRCRSLLDLFPAKAPDVIRCPGCKFQPPFGPEDLKAVRKLLPREKQREK
jgi:hypothetical protein